MYPLFESIKVIDGKMQHTEWHQKRYERSYKTLYERLPLSNITSHVTVPDEASQGVYKLRISYNDRYKKIEFHSYAMKAIRTLKLVELDEIDYKLKYQNRESLLTAFEQRGTCDDVLIIRNGMVTDSSYANIIFRNGEQWFTPKNPLLDGTAKDRLLHEGRIQERAISLKDVASFQSFKLINALRDIDEVEELGIENILG